MNGQYRIRPNGNRQYPEGFIHNLSRVGHGSRVPPPTVHLVVCPNPQCQFLVRYGVQDLLVCQFGFGLHLELAALIDFRAPGIVAAVVPTLFVTFAVVHRKVVGILKHYYLDEFNKTGVFIRHKRGMQSSVAIEDRREGSLPNNRPLLPTTLSVIIPRLF